MDTPTLMLIDDEFGVRESIKMVFGKQYRLLEADSAEAALPLVETARPEVILLDVMMPKTDGIEMLQRIKTIHADCAVIMLTGVNSQQLAEKARNFGAWDFIGKPFDIADLRAKVARAFERTSPPAPPEASPTD
jgi:DNA-binding NtrC family response regulator